MNSRQASRIDAFATALVMSAITVAGCSSSSDTGQQPKSVQGQPTPTAGTSGFTQPSTAGSSSLPIAGSSTSTFPTAGSSAAVGGGPALGGSGTGGTRDAGVPSAGSGGAGGAFADGGAAGSDASAAGSSGSAGSGGTGTGACCSDGNCLCHGDVPTDLTDAAGPYKTAMSTITTGTLYYPMDAEPPFAAVALCAGFLNTGPEMATWGPLYASYGIVTVIVTTGAADLPDVRGMKLLAAIAELKKLQTDSKSPISGKLSDRFGTSGYSMGGGGTTLASAQDSTLKSSIGLAPWGGNGMGIKVPTLLLCGETDTVAPCNMAQSVYTGMPDGTQKMLVSIPNTTHFNWFNPTDAGGGTSGKYALAFEKVFLEGDTRWKSLLLKKPMAGMQTTNIQ